MFTNINSFLNEKIEFFHGSAKKLNIGTILVPQADGYVNETSEKWLEELFEKYRPLNKLSRLKSVFICDDIDEIEAAGGYLDYIYKVKPIDIPEKSDLAWYTEVQLLPETDEYNIIKAIKNYWNGIQYHDIEMSVWEYRTSAAKIIKLIEEN